MCWTRKDCCIGRRAAPCPAFKRYLTPASGAPVTDMVLDIPPLSAGAKERLGYPTQKPLALLERIIRASSNEGGRGAGPILRVCHCLCRSGEAG